MDGTENIATFLATKKILIVDASNASRFSVIQALAELGADRRFIRSVKDFNDAVQDIQERKPEIVVSEFNIKDAFGLDLLRTQVESLPNPDEKLFILITGNSSESAIAEAAEEDVDCYILKPFSGNVLAEYLVKTFTDRIQPSPYHDALQRAKKLLSNAQATEAIEVLREAKRLDPHPALACYYLGRAFEAAKDFEFAVSQYKEGLDHNPIHYKCLVGLFEALEQMDQKKAAYEVIRKLVENFPVSPQRLGKIFTLAAYTYNFVDMESYYEHFNRLDRRPDDLVRTVTAGLLVCGKYLLQKGNLEGAVKVFQKAAASSGRSTIYLEKIVNSLIAHKHFDEADRFLRMFPPEEQDSAIFKQLDFIISDAVEPKEKVAEKGRRLILEGFEDPIIYKTVLKHLVALDRVKAAETILYKAIARYPEMKQIFLDLVEKKKADTGNAG